MSTLDLVICGTIVTPSGPIENGWIGVVGDRISTIGSGAPPDARQRRDEGDAWICPGFIDGQTHACSYGGSAGLESTTRSAVAGGITTIVDMPYDNPDPLDTCEALARKAAAIERLAYCDVALYGTIAKGQPVEELRELAAAGICAVKLSSFESHPVRFPRIPSDQILKVLEAMADTALPVGLHNEDQEIVQAKIAEFKSAGKTTIDWHSDSRPIAAELAATAAFLEMGAASGAHVHLVHLSNARGYELVARYREEGFKATAELCVHYLHFDPAEDAARLGAKLKVNPPIRPGMTNALWHQLDAGHVEFVSSDHSSWPIDNKFTDSIFDAGAGMTGLETLVPSFATDLSVRGLDPLPLLSRHLAESPARFFGLWPRKGGIMVGADADIVVLTRQRVRFSASKTQDGLNWSAYDGEEFHIRVAATYVRGNLVWDDGQIVGRPGQGTFVRRTGTSIFAEQATPQAFDSGGRHVR